MNTNLNISYLNIPSKTSTKNMKRLIFIISFIYLIAFTSSTISNKPSNKNKELRNLQYSHGSIYYELQYPLNNITGTGDRLKDVPYKVQCKLLACDSGCCVGEIDNLSCGPEVDCLIYLENSKSESIIIGIVVSFGLLIILIILFVTFLKVFKFSISASFCLSIGCMSVILIPWVVYFVHKERKNVTCKNKSKEV